MTATSSRRRCRAAGARRGMAPPGDRRLPRALSRRDGRRARSVPADPGAAAALIDFFTLEKAFYEIGYELANRPAWAAIPLAGVLELLEPKEAAVPTLSTDRPRHPRGTPRRSLRLSRHACRRRRSCVRVFLPWARRVWVLDAAPARSRASCQRIHADGLFVRHARPAAALPLSPARRRRRTARSSSTTSMPFRRCSAISTSICWARARISRATT